MIRDRKDSSVCRSNSKTRNLSQGFLDQSSNPKSIKIHLSPAMQVAKRKKMLSQLPDIKDTLSTTKGGLEYDKELVEVFSTIEQISPRKIQLNQARSQSQNILKRTNNSTPSLLNVVTKVEAFKKLNYRQETFYRPKEVFPSYESLQESPRDKTEVSFEISKEDPNNKGLLQMLLFRKIQNNISDAISHNSVDTSLYKAAQKVYSIDIDSQQQDNGEKVREKSVDQQSDYQRKLYNFSAQSNITQCVPLMIKPPVALRIKDQKQQKVDEQKVIQYKLDKVTKLIWIFQKQLEKMKSQHVVNNALLYEKSNLQESISKSENVQAEIKILQSKIDLLSAKEDRIRNEMRESQDTKAYIVVNENIKVSDRESCSGLLERKIALADQSPNQYQSEEKKIESGRNAMKRGMKKFLEKKAELERQNKKQDQKQREKKQAQIKRLQDDLNKARKHDRGIDIGLGEIEEPNGGALHRSAQVEGRDGRKSSDDEIIWNQLHRDDTNDTQETQRLSNRTKNEDSLEVDDSPLNQDEETEETINIMIQQQLSQNMKIHKDESNQILPIFKREQEAQEKLERRSEFLDLFKIADSYSEEMEMSAINRVQVKYILETLANKEVPLPLLHKIKDNVIYLENYLLSTSKCDAVCIIIEYLGQIDLRGIVLSNNQSTDEGISKIINTIKNTKKIKVFSCEKNQVGKQSAEALIDLLSRRPPYNLESLKICDSKLTSIPLAIILKELQFKCWLKRLCLNKVNMTQDCLEILADVINNQQSLYALDISWNEFTQKTFWDFLNMIKENQTLKELKLSMLPINGPLSSMIVDSLNSMILTSNCLIHLEVSHCGMQEEEIRIIVETMKRSKTLTCVHLSGNLISKSLKVKIRNILHIDYSKREKYLMKMRKQMFSLPTQVNEIVSLELQNQPTQQPAQSCPTNANTGRKSSSTNKNSKGIFFTMPEDIVIYSRQLGHCEIPNAYHWKEQDFCWVCERWQYVVIIYSSKIAQQDVSQYQRINNQLNKHYQKQFKQNQEKRNIEEMKAEAQIQFTGEEEKGFCNMMSLQDFKLKLEENLVSHYQFGERYISSEDHEIVLQKKKFEEKLKRHHATLKSRKRLYDCILLAKQKFERYVSINELKSYLDNLKENQYVISDQMDLQLLEYADLDFNFNQNMAQKVHKLFSDLNAVLVSTQFANKSTIDLIPYQQQFKDNLYSLDEDVFVFAKILPPGLNQFTIRSKKKCQEQYKAAEEYLLNFNVPERAKDLDVSYKKKKKMRVNRFFQKQMSVFKKWREDSDDILNEMFENDMKQTKVYRIIRDQNELEETLAVLRKNLPLLKEIYGYCSSQSSYPNISWLDFSDYCDQFKIIDKNCTISKVDMAFIATNVELVNNDDNPDRDLNRYEFYEILIRIANEKYKKPGLCKRFPAALTRLIQDCFIANYTPIFTYQDFRIKYLWTLEVDDVFQLNIFGCKKLYEQFMAVNKRYMDPSDAYYLISIQGNQLGIEEEPIKQAFVYSKMSVIDVNEQEKFSQMSFVEFLEFIARIAHIVVTVPIKAKEMLLLHQEKEELGLPEKIEYVLDILLPKVNVKRKTRDALKDKFDSDSDYD